MYIHIYIYIDVSNTARCGIPPTKSFDPLGMSFTASSAVEQNTGLGRALDVENNLCFPTACICFSLSQAYNYARIIKEVCKECIYLSAANRILKQIKYFILP